MDKQMKVMARAMLVNMPTTNKQIVKKGVLQQKLEGIKEKNKFGLKNAGNFYELFNYSVPNSWKLSQSLKRFY